MKIDNPLKKTSGPVSDASGARGRKEAEGTSATPGSSAAKTDTVHLSAQLKSLALSSGSAVFDAKKVEEIKSAIAEGRFRVDPEKVAAGLLDSVNDLIRSRKA